MTESTQTSTPEIHTVPVQPRRSGWRTFWWLFSIVLFICALCGIFPLVLLWLAGSTSPGTEKGVDDLTYTYVAGNKTSENKLLAIYIDQPILSSSQDYNDDLVTSLLVGQYVFGYKVKDELIKAVDDSSIKGVMLIINSPGGTVVGARAIADGVAYYRDHTHKPVYAYVEDMAASGAYWAAASADTIIAEQGSLVGSIGVIMGPFEYYDKLVTMGSVGTQGGISISYITGGKYKDLGNPTRKISEEEMRVLQAGIDDEYDKFVQYVSQRRGITTTTIKDEIKALIYGASQADKYELIDAVGNREAALTALADKAGVTNDFKLVKIGSSTSLFGSLFAMFNKDTITQKSETPARTCVLCNKPLYFYGNPLDY